MPERRLLVVGDPAAAAADVVVADLCAAARQRGAASLVLAGGGTPLALYRMLAERSDVDWGSIHTFWGDERLVGPDDPGSNYRAAREALLSRVDLPAAHIHRMRGELPPDEAAADYAARLRDWAAAHDPGAPNPWPRFDVVLLGLGEDGHTASLFPGSPLSPPQPVVAVTADYQGRPAGRITLTPRVFNDARHVIFLVAGAGKAEAARETFYADDPARLPAQRIRPDYGRVTWLLDRAAAGKND